MRRNELITMLHTIRPRHRWHLGRLPSAINYKTNATWTLRQIGTDASRMHSPLGTMAAFNTEGGKSSQAQGASETAQQVASEASAYETVLDGTGFTSFWASVVNDVHVLLDVPYWEAILIVTAIIRAINIPLFFRSVGSGARMRRIMPHLNNIMKRFSESRAKGDEATAMTLYKQRAQLMKDHNVGILRSFVPLIVQAPMALGMIWALRELSIDADHIESFRNGGTLWFQHLDAPDPLYALPAFTAVTGILSAVLNPNTQGIPTLGITGDKMKRIGIGFGAFFGIVSTQFPAGTQLYFAATSLSMCLQQSLLRSNFFKKLAGIPVEFPNVEPLPLSGQTVEEARAMQKQYEDEQAEKMKQNPFVKAITETLGTDDKSKGPEKGTESYVSWKGIQNPSPPPPPSPSSESDKSSDMGSSVSRSRDDKQSQEVPAGKQFLTKEELDARKRDKSKRRKK